MEDISMYFPHGLVSKTQTYFKQPSLFIKTQ